MNLCSRDRNYTPHIDALVHALSAAAWSAAGWPVGARVRDALIALDPLSKPHIIEVNRAEAAFWAKAGGQRID